MKTTTPPTTDDAAGAPPEAGAENAEQPTLTQGDLERILAERLERQKKQLLKQIDQAKDEEATKQLEAAAEWQKLADKRQEQLAERDRRLADLESQAALAEKYGAALDGYVTQLSEGLPAAITSLLEPMDAAARLEWLTANRSQFVQADADTATTPTPEPPKRPLPETPKPQGNGALSAEERRKRAARTF
jgi:hypothetical protein